MNLLKHYIIKIHSIIDITKEFEEKCGFSPNEPLFKVDLTCDCYGVVKRYTRNFYKSELKFSTDKGYFMA